jgi:hypothetical protein
MSISDPSFVPVNHSTVVILGPLTGFSPVLDNNDGNERRQKHGFYNGSFGEKDWHRAEQKLEKQQGKGKKGNVWGHTGPKVS